MSRKLLVVLSAVALNGCVSIAAPVRGQLSTGEMLHGTTTARMDGNGDFWVESPSGMRCSGKYDSLTSVPTFVVPVTCTDGRSGRVAVTRDTGKVSGTATGRLSDGTEARFAFGDRHFTDFYPPRPVVVVPPKPAPVIIVVPGRAARPAPPPLKPKSKYQDV